MRICAPLRLSLILGLALTLASCAAPEKVSVAAKPTAPISGFDDREYDIASQSWERPPPHGPRGNRALANY
jgi:hypothetical protein